MDIQPELPDRLARDLDGAFEELVRGHERLVFGLALRVVGDRADAEEVAQDTFERAYHALAGYEAGRVAAMRLRPWLARIALNLARNRLRRPAPPTPSRPRSPSAARSGSCWSGCWPPCPAHIGRRWCCATSRACPTPRSPRSWAGPWARSRPMCTGGCGSCGWSWRTGRSGCPDEPTRDPRH